MPINSPTGSSSPARPGNVRDLELAMNGRPIFLGVLVSTGAAVDNSTTAIPFNSTVASNAGPTTVTLAGKVLLVQPTAAGHIYPSSVPLLGAPGGTPTVTTFASAGPFVGTVPGLKIQTEERVPFIMLPSDCCLQWIPSSGSANLFVWEIV